jgi:WD40 repeat protein
MYGVGNGDEDARLRCPYQGLAPFAAENSDVFFGRARATRGLIERLGRRLNGRGAIMMVTGASGVGKSSLLRAGLLPALADGMLPVDGSRRWPRLVMTPTAEPRAALAACLAGADGERVPSGRAGAERVILVVDQFEELFTLVADEHERQAFVGALHTMAGRSPGAAVIVGVRADYWDRCAAYPQFAEAIQDGQIIVEPMTESDLRLAITGPAAAAGLEIEPGLVETILSDLRTGRDAADRYAPGALPLLSQALRNTWHRRRDGTLTIRGYEESGRVRDAVMHTAEEVFQRLSAEERTTALRIFRRMTVIAAGGRVARRPATLTEIHAAVAADSADRRGRVGALVSAFADRRLLTLHEDTAEISHDVLLTAWPALRQWLAPDLTAQAVYDQLIGDAAQWDEHHRDPAFLYRGVRLLSVRDARPRWAGDPDSFPPPGPTVDGFVAASTRAVRRAEHRRRLAMGGLAALTVIALIAAGAAVNAARDADHQRALAVARGLAVQSQVVGDTDPAISALLAVAGWRIAPTAESRQSVISAVARPGRGILFGHRAPLTAMAFSRSGSVFATGALDGTARLWDVATRRQLGAPITHPHDDGGTGIDAVAFLPGGKVVVTAQLATVRFWDISTHRASGAPLANEDPITAMAVSPDGMLLATASYRGAIRLWDVTARRRRGAPIRATEAKAESDRVVSMLAFSPDGTTLASAGADKTARLWDVTTHRQIGTSFTGHTGRVSDVAFSPDGTTLATAGADGTARLWRLTTHRQVGRPLANPVRRGDVDQIAFSPDGRRIITAGRDIRLWDTARHESIGPAFPDDENSASASVAAFSPDGRLFATGGTDGFARLWDPVIHEQIGSAMSGVGAVAKTPEGRIVAVSDAAGADRTMRLWDVVTHRRAGAPLRPTDRTLGTGKPGVFALDFSPTRRMLATTSSIEGTRLWDAATHRQIGAPLRIASGGGAGAVFSRDGSLIGIVAYESLELRRITGGGQDGRGIAAPRSQVFTAMAFSPDGTTLAAAAGDRSVRLFDLATGRQIGTPLPAGTGGSYNDELVFSPDGRALATTEEDRAVRLWDVKSHRQIGVPLVGHTARVSAIAFSPDGKYLATGSEDTTVRVWDLATHRPIGIPLIGHTAAVRSVVYGPDGRTVASYGEDSTVRLWNVAVPADPAAAACANAGRSLTPAEWQRYLPEEKFQQICP